MAGLACSACLRLIILIRIGTIVFVMGLQLKLGVMPSFGQNSHQSEKNENRNCPKADTESETPRKESNRVVSPHVGARFRIFSIQHEVKRNAKTIHVMKASDGAKEEPSCWYQTDRQKAAADNL